MRTIKGFSILKSIGPVVALGIAAGAMQGCGEDSLTDAAGGSCELNASIEALADANAKLTAVAGRMEASMTTACDAIAGDQKAEGDVKAKCDAAAKVIGELKAEAGGSLGLTITEGKCEINASAQVSCEAECTADVDCEPPSLEARCKGGEICSYHK